MKRLSLVFPARGTTAGDHRHIQRKKSNIRVNSKQVQQVWWRGTKDRERGSVRSRGAEGVEQEAICREWGEGSVGKEEKERPSWLIRVRGCYRSARHTPAGPLRAGTGTRDAPGTCARRRSTRPALSITAAHRLRAEGERKRRADTQKEYTNTSILTQRTSILTCARTREGCYYCR